MAGHATLQIYQGDDYTAVVNVTNVDGSPANLSGYTAAAQIRGGVADDDATVAAEMTTSVQSPNIFISLTHAQTTPMAGAYFWDLQIVDSVGKVTTILAGDAVVTQEVTRE